MPQKSILDIEQGFYRIRKKEMGMKTLNDLLWQTTNE